MISNKNSGIQFCFQIQIYFIFLEMCLEFLGQWQMKKIPGIYLWVEQVSL